MNGQTSRQQQEELKQSFQTYKIFRLSAAAARSGAARRGESLTLEVPTAGGKDFVLDLAPRDLRAPQYRAETTTADGGRRPLFDSGAVNTFRGRVAGQANSEARLTIDGETVEGYFFADAEKFFIEPARRYSKLASEADLIVYREEDYLNSESYFCHSQLGAKIERGRRMAAESAASVQALSPVRVIELATEADFEYVNFHGGAAQANAEILGILNMVEGVYENQLGLTFDVVYQHAWTTPDPYAATSASALLPSFRNYWNANFGQIARDAAHIWTAKPNASAQGLAYLQVICANPGSAYGLSGLVQWTPAKYDVTAHEIGHNLNANHADAGECGNTIMNSTLTATTPLTFCGQSRSEIVNYVTATGACLSPRPVAATVPTRFDFDGDGKADPTVFRPATGLWAILNSGSGSYSLFQFGMLGDRAVPADYDGDGKTDAAVYRGGVWYRLRSSTSTFDTVYFGLASDTPAPADYDGDGKTDAAVYRGGVWYRLNSSNGAFSAGQFGLPGDVPMPADFDGDGKADVSLWRPSNGVWYRLNSRDNSFFAAQFGSPGDRPVAGDFDGDRKFDLAVFRPNSGYWYAALSGNSNAMLAAPFGVATDTPAPADYDGDGKTDLAVYRDGVWHRMTSANNAYSAFSFGLPTDVPAPAFYQPQQQQPAP